MFKKISNSTKLGSFLLSVFIVSSVAVVYQIANQSPKESQLFNTPINDAPPITNTDQTTEPITMQPETTDNPNDNPVTANEPQSTQQTSPVNIFNCQAIDCFYAAVDKTNALPASYQPNVVATTLPSGGQMVPQAAQALSSLTQAANDAGIGVEITSSYRSYQTQVSTFNNWVKIIKNRNPSYSQAQAEAEANTFSARPGHSEHQLGTTVDLNTPGAEPFSNSGNSALYKFIEENAHKFGFVITYPKGQQAVTGYVHEPWHIRYIGVDLANELFATGYVDGNGNHSTQFLRDKGLST